MLSFDFEPIRDAEIEEETKRYQVYIDTFSAEKVSLYPLAYVITKGESGLSHVDLWYERDAGERIGDYNLYHVKLRR